MARADVLIIIDMQNGVCRYENESLYNLEKIILEIQKLIAEYKAESKPIVFIQHMDEYLQKGSYKWEIVSELNTEVGSYFVEKSHPNSFYKTELEDILNAVHAKSIEICGAETQYCVDSTIKFAHGLGFTVVMHRDTHSGWETEEMTSDKMIQFYEKIWDDRFVTFV